MFNNIIFILIYTLLHGIICIYICTTPVADFIVISAQVLFCFCICILQTSKTSPELSLMLSCQDYTEFAIQPGSGETNEIVAGRRKGQDRTGPDRTGQNRTEQYLTGRNGTGRDGTDGTGRDWTGRDRTGRDRTGPDRTYGRRDVIIGTLYATRRRYIVVDQRRPAQSASSLRRSKRHRI